MIKIVTIKTRKDFVRVQNNPLFKAVGNDLIIICKETDKKYFIKDYFSRVGLVVTKRIDKRAVIRNKIKRKIREIIRFLSKNSCNLFINRIDYIIIAKNSFLSNSHAFLIEEIKELLLKIKVKYER